jgi:hypothetical protein
LISSICLDQNFAANWINYNVGKLWILDRNLYSICCDGSFPELCLVKLEICDGELLAINFE